MGEFYPEIIERQGVVTTQLQQEEERFARTLNAGTDVAGRELERIKRRGETTVPGDLAFDLYQTHGIPVDLLDEFAQEEGLTLDRERFERCLLEEKERGQASWKGDVQARLRAEYEALAERGLASSFEGYDSLDLETEVVALLDGDGEIKELGQGASGEVVLEATPFYAESGGQVGDHGRLSWGGGTALVTDTQRPIEGLIVHTILVEEGRLQVGGKVTASVTTAERLDTQRNHTATHLLHSALRGVLGQAAQQAGSLVEPDRLRFDFNWGQPVSFDQLQAIERRVNEAIINNQSVTKSYMSVDAARELGAMALFGEKYGETVRVVSVGDGNFSRELCGGCHVRRTGDIGLFVILGERGVAAGVRRIEAVAGRGAIELIQQRSRIAAELTTRYQTSFEGLPGLLKKRAAHFSALEEEVRSLKHKLATGGGGADEVRVDIGGISVLARHAPEMSSSELRDLADTLRQRLGSGVVILGMESGGKATLLVAVTEDLVPRLKAGEIVKPLAEIVGGRGGGRPNLAQAGGPDVERLDEALEKAPAVIESLTSS